MKHHSRFSRVQLLLSLSLRLRTFLTTRSFLLRRPPPESRDSRWDSSRSKVQGLQQLPTSNQWIQLEFPIGFISSHHLIFTSSSPKLFFSIFLHSPPPQEDLLGPSRPLRAPDTRQRRFTGKRSDPSSPSAGEIRNFYFGVDSQKVAGSSSGYGGGGREGRRARIVLGAFGSSRYGHGEGADPWLH